MELNRLKTYNAILQNGHLDWVEEAPISASAGKPVKVHVTILENAIPTDENERGPKMAEILEQIAHRCTAFTDIHDPAKWQRQIRQDRPQPNNVTR